MVHELHVLFSTNCERNFLIFVKRDLAPLFTTVFDDRVETTGDFLGVYFMPLANMKTHSSYVRY